MIVRELFAKLGLSVDAASFAVADQMLGAVKSGLGLLVSGAVRASEGLTEIITKTVETFLNFSGLLPTLTAPDSI